MKIHELGHIVLYVSNLEESSYFYREVLGFTEIDKTKQIALYSSGRTHHELLLIEVGGEKISLEKLHQPSAGLYHIGFKVGNSREDLQKAHDELVSKGVRIIGATDHHVTHSLYILDPDNNELELYADISDDWKKDPKVILQQAKRLYL